MINKLFKTVFGSVNEREVVKLEKTVAQINALEADYQKLDDATIKSHTEKFKARIEAGESLDKILPEAFATVREAAKRTLGQRHYDVQLMGGITLHHSRIAEMKTGEGKTLVSTLPIYLNAIAGKGVHVVTVNDYLAKRDCEWMSEIYEFLGLNAKYIQANMEHDARKAAYDADITYGTNNEFGFDYLRDNMKFSIEEMVQRPFNFAVIDEVDSILIDEARTPLIISGPAQDSSELYTAVNGIIPELKEGPDFEKDEKSKSITLTESGNDHIEEVLKEKGFITEGGLYDIENVAYIHHINQALKAHKLFEKDKDYIVHDNKIVIIDEFTGRMMEGRRFSEGLHQALEAKEGVAINHENQTLASITFQNYFRLYPKLAGMTGTAATEADEFAQIYNLDVLQIPSHRGIQRVDENDLIYRTAAEKFEAIIEHVKICHKRKQPVLIGTISIEQSEALSKRLKKEKLTHSVLNARQHEQEAQIIANAGRLNAITIATNMAGRGTDIQLGGSDEETQKAEKQDVLDAGGLFIIGTERHESRRIDNQLRGRSGRQGDPGASLFLLSLEDDLMRIFGSERMDKVLKTFGLQEGEAITHPWVTKAIEKAQKKVEAHNFDIRKMLLKFDDVMNDQRKIIYEQRKEIMASETVTDTIDEMRQDLIDHIVKHAIPANSYPEKWDIKFLHEECIRLFGLTLDIQAWANEEGIAEPEIKTRIEQAVKQKMTAKSNEYGAHMMQAAEKHILLQVLDDHWKNHLLSLDHLRKGINLRAYGQRDPLNEYKLESFSHFEQMLDQIREKTAMVMTQITIAQERPEDIQVRKKSQMVETKIEFGPAGNQKPVESDPNDPNSWGKVTRNEVCPCGSGKKYKHCHGAVAASQG